MLATSHHAETDRIDAALHPAASFSRQQFTLALIWTMALPLLIYCLIFAMALCKSEGMRRLGLSKFGPILDYGYEARDINADIVLFGDSSAFLGIDPRVVDSALHLRTVVLPNTIGSLPVTDDLVLRRYLAHNRPPSVIVLYFTPWDLDYRSAKKEFQLEGDEELLRYGSWSEIAHAFRRDPRQLLAFPFQSLEPIGLRHIRAALNRNDTSRGEETIRAFGHWDYTLPYDPLQPSCALREEYTEARPRNTVRELEAKYTAPGRQVIAYLAPVPNCSNTVKVLSRSYRDVPAQPPAVLPPSWFADDSFSAHIRPEHVQQNSILFAQAVRAELLRRNNPPASGNSY